MDLPLQDNRWKARMTKQEKSKQANVYFKKIIVLMSAKREPGGVNGVAELDRGYRTHYRSFCNRKQTIYGLHNNSSTYRYKSYYRVAIVYTYSCLLFRTRSGIMTTPACNEGLP